MAIFKHHFLINALDLHPSYRLFNSSKDNCLDPNLVSLRQVIDDPIAGVACGSRHSIAWTTTGHVVTCGSNFNAQLSYDYCIDDYKSPQISPRIMNTIPLKLPVTSVASGSRHSLLVLNDGTVAACGSNSCGQLGLDNDGRDSEVPVVIESLHNVVQVQCGEAHSLALTGDGQVYCWGSKIACRSKANVLEPQLVTGFGTSKVVAIGAGGRHSLALDKGGALYSWGDNGASQLGHPSDAATLSARPVVGLPNTVISFDGGECFSAAVLASGELYMWGQNVNNVMSSSALNTKFALPILVQLPSKVCSVVCGGWHVVALRPQGYAEIQRPNNDIRISPSKHKLDDEDLDDESCAGNGRRDSESDLGSSLNVPGRSFMRKCLVGISESEPSTTKPLSGHHNQEIEYPTRHDDEEVYSSPPIRPGRASAPVTMQHIASPDRIDTVKSLSDDSTNEGQKARPVSKKGVSFISNNAGHLLNRPQSRSHTVSPSPAATHNITGKTKSSPPSSMRIIIRDGSSHDLRRSSTPTGRLSKNEQDTAVHHKTTQAAGSTQIAASTSNRSSSMSELPPIISMPGRKPGFSSGSSWRK